MLAHAEYDSLKNVYDMIIDKQSEKIILAKKY